MKQKDFKNWSPLRIFVSYFGTHKKLFIIDMCCAFLVAMVDLLYPLISRHALNELLPQPQQPVRRTHTLWRSVLPVLLAVLVFRG